MTGELLERIALVAPLGIRLRDVVTGRTVDDVDVRVAPSTAPWRTTAAVRTPSGVYTAHGLPGLRRWERRDVGPDELPTPVENASLPHRIEVRDRAGRFHSFVVETLLPVDGLLTPPCDSPPGSPPQDGAGFLPVFSLPGRPVPAVTAVVRARLALPDGTPAAFAALDVVPADGAAPVRGIADRRGEVVVMFPYPRPPALAGSPPSGSRSPLSRTTWSVTLEGLLPARVPALDALPDLCLFLDQSPAPLRTRTSPPEPVDRATLRFGQELVLCSSPGDPTVVIGA